MSSITKCLGCGAPLQNQNSSLVGYTLSFDNEYCVSCYKLLHYGQANIHFHPEDLPNLMEDSIVLMISSVLHLDLLFSYPIYRYQSQAKFVYIINQIDLLPKSTNLDLLIDNITLKAKKQSIPYEDIILMSSKNSHDIENLRNYLRAFKKKNIYLVGVQNSGKTTIFKELTQDDKPLAFKKAGLTQQAISKPFLSHILYDMPGLYQEGYIHEMLDYQVYKNLIPDHEIKPKIYQLKADQSLIIEGIIAFSVLKDSNVTLYLSDYVKIHKTNILKVNDLLANKEKHFRIFVDSYQKKSLKVLSGKQQITFADFGFMHIDGPVTIDMMVPSHLHISLTEALFK
jgi:30S ribosome assembly GTPase